MPSVHPQICRTTRNERDDNPFTPNENDGERPKRMNQLKKEAAVDEPADLPKDISQKSIVHILSPLSRLDVRRRDDRSS